MNGRNFLLIEDNFLSHPKVIASLINVDLGPVQSMFLKTAIENSF